MAGIGRPKGSHDISTQIRGAFIRAVKGLEDDGKPLSTIIRKELEHRPLETLRVMSSFMPKEAKITGKVEHEHTHIAVSETLSFLEEITTGESESTLPESGPDRPVLPN